MLLAIDVGNTQMSIGLFEQEVLQRRWRLSSNRDRTTDDFLLLIRGLLQPEGLRWDHLEGAAISSVVPDVATAMRPAVEQVVAGPVVVVGPGVKTGLAIRIDNPREVGADRVVNSVAALGKYGGPVVVVDFGTATTFDVVDGAGDYVGGAIAPGIEISMDALVASTAALRRVDLAVPRSVIGKGTVEALQSGLLYGYAGLVDGIVGRIHDDIGRCRVVATGGIAPTVTRLMRTETTLDASLTLDGLRMIFERNR